MSTGVQLLLVASLLRRGRTLDRLSNALTLAALAIGLAPLLGVTSSLAVAGPCALLVLLGLMQHYWAQRVALDAELFQHLAQSPERLETHAAQLDSALAELGLRPNDKPSRTWAERSRAALCLLRVQLFLLIGQYLLALLLILAQPWSSIAG
jgi:hypothetical protein